LKKATRVEAVLVLTMLHDAKSVESLATIVAVTVVAIEAHAAEVATVVVVAEIVEAEVAIAVDAVVIEADAAESAVAIGDHVENDVTSMVTAAVVKTVDHVLIGLTVMVKVAEIVVQGVLPVDTMVATAVQVHHADAKLSN
jgi:hypothetical protein